MILAAAEYGVFAPLVAIVTAIMAAGGAIVLLWAGRLEKWRPVGADLPGLAKRIVFVACSVAMALLALDVKPETLGEFKRLAWALLAASVGLGIAYAILRQVLYHSKINPNGKGRSPVLGGVWMKKAAKASMRKNHLTEIDDLLDGSPGPQAIWSVPSRILARLLVLGTFIFFVVSATAALTSAGLITYVRMTGKPLL